MDYAGIFEISASGMDYQAKRLEVIASNLANINTTRGINGRLYQPLVALASADSGQFDQLLGGVAEVDIVERQTAPRLVFNPAHPDADAQGYVAMPNINPVDEMLAMMTATRAYEANIRALNAARTMAMRALEIGSKG